jgi:hypothetical protein
VIARKLATAEALEYAVSTNKENRHPQSGDPQSKIFFLSKTFKTSKKVNKKILVGEK